MGVIGSWKFRHLLATSIQTAKSLQHHRNIYRSIYAKIKRIGEQAGIGKLHPHMLRHTYLTRLYNVEKDLRFVQDQAGHASPTTTAIYAKTNNKARKRQVQALDEELK